MIKIIDEEEYNNGSYMRDEKGWDFSIEELDYLLEEHNGETFLLQHNRLYEVIDYVDLTEIIDKVKGE